MGLLPDSGVMQAPVGPPAAPELVAAVSRAGAPGTLAASWTDARDLREQIGGDGRRTSVDTITRREPADIVARLAKSTG